MKIYELVNAIQSGGGDIGARIRIWDEDGETFLDPVSATVEDGVLTIHAKYSDEEEDPYND